MNARRLLCICTGLLVLIVGYSLVAPRVGAQGSSTLVAIIDSASATPTHYAMDSAGRLFSRDEAGWAFLAQCPPGRPADLRVAPYHGNNYLIGMENGDVYTFPIDNPPGQPLQFTYLGNVFSGIVQVEGKSWSGVKDGYRKQD